MNRVFADLLAVVGITAATFLGAAYFALHEAFSRWVSPYERWQLDELPLTLLALASALSWFALRRWRVAAAEADWDHLGQGSETGAAVSHSARHRA